MEYHKACIITIGDELLNGQTIDTNSVYIAEKCKEVGIKIEKKYTIADRKEDILLAFDEAAIQGDITFVTGGLGPTKDDITKWTIAEYIDSDIIEDKIRLKELEDFFESRGRIINDLNKSQALIPRKAIALSNKVGTANGMCFEKNNHLFFSMPGVPFEMKYLLENEVFPLIQKRFHLKTIHHHFFETIGIGESDLSIKIENWENKLPNHLKLAYLPSLQRVTLRLSDFSDGKEKNINEIKNELIDLLKEHLYHSGDKKSPQEKVVELLTKQNKTLSTAESCTGGNIARLLTEIPGASSIFQGSIVAYDNSVKTNLLDIPKGILSEYGAVSQETVELMAQNIRKKLHTDIGIATSGIAGPSGGTEQKPVGTIWIAYSDKDKTVSKLLNINRSRTQNIHIASNKIFELILKNLDAIG